jgi:hypothetical protein
LTHSPASCLTLEQIRAAVFVNRLLLVGQLVVTLNVISTLAAEAADASFKFAGVPFSPGSTVRANVPLGAQEKSYAGQGGNPVPQSAVAVLATPANFDPRKRRIAYHDQRPILVRWNQEAILVFLR